MLRQWFKSPAVIALGTEGIALRPAGGGSVRMIASGAEPYSREQLLVELQMQAGALQAAKQGLHHVRFILSNQFARYLVLPWHPGVYALQDWRALAAHEFRKQFGAMAENWEIRVALQGHGAPAVACALDRELVGQLSALSAAAGWIVHGVEPALMTVFNRHRVRLAKPDHWLLLAEPQRLLLGQLKNGAWQNFQVDSPLAGEEAAAGRHMVERALRLQAGTRPSAVACFGPAALLPDSLPDDLTIMRLPQAAAAQRATTLDLLAEAA